MKNNEKSNKKSGQVLISSVVSKQILPPNPKKDNSTILQNNTLRSSSNSQKSKQNASINNKSNRASNLDNIGIKNATPRKENLKTMSSIKSKDANIDEINGHLPPLFTEHKIKHSLTQPICFDDESKRATIQDSKKKVSPGELNNLIGQTSVANTTQIKVISRFRPLNSVEKELDKDKANSSICCKFVSQQSVEVINTMNSPQTFTLDRIFDVETSQAEVYHETAKAMIQDVLKGYNGTIFTYGQSGSGKTYSMYGTDLYDDFHKGIIPRTIEEIFDYINSEENKSTRFELKFSMLEIYKENLYDLLNSSIKPSDLKIKEHPQRGIYVTNLTEEYISTEEEFLLHIEAAEESRTVSETGLNQASSRSHLLFLLEIKQTLEDGTQKKGILNLIDLAGSEKIAKTHAQGETLEEAKKINLSLSTLGNVISALTSNKGDHVPYRDSKLTRILQDSLGGNYKTTLIVTCSPHIYNCEETISTLKFASRAKKIKNKVKINIKKSVEQLEAIIEALSSQLNVANQEIARLKNTNDFKSFLNEPIESTVPLDSVTNEKINSLERDNFSNDIRESEFNNPFENKIPNMDIDNLLTIKDKDDEIEALKEKIQKLNDDNAELNERISEKEMTQKYFNEVLNKMENFIQINIEDYKEFNLNKEEKEIKRLNDENIQLRQNYENLEMKYLQILKEIESKLINSMSETRCSQCLNKIKEDDRKDPEINVLDIDKMQEDLYKFDVNFKNITLNFSDSQSYKMIYDTSKLYLNSILKEYLKKQNIINSKYDCKDYDLIKAFRRNYYIPDEVEFPVINSHLNRNASNNINLTGEVGNESELYLKKDIEVVELKSILMKMIMLGIYYEKITFDLMNRFSVDIRKNYFDNQNKVYLEKKFQTFSENLVLFLEVIQTMKKITPIETEEFKYVTDENRSPLSPVYQIDEVENEDQTPISKPFKEEVNNTNSSKKVSFKNLKKGQTFFQRDIEEIDQPKESRLENNLEMLRKFNLIKQDTFYNKTNEDLKFNDSKNNILEGIQRKSNSNVARPVAKLGRMNTLNLLFNKLQKEGLIPGNANTQSHFIPNQSVNENEDSLKMIQRHKTMSRKLKFPNLDSFCSNARGSFKDNNIDLDVKNIMKEVKLYKVTIDNLSNELLYLRNNNIEQEKIIKDYQENQRRILESEIDNFKNSLKLHKSFYEEELKKNRNTIENLVKIIDDMLMNFTSNEGGKTNRDEANSIFKDENSTNSKNKTLISNFYQIKKDQAINNQTSSIENRCKSEVFESLMHDTGNATKKLDYIVFEIEKKEHLKIKYGSGLHCVNPSKSPISQNFKIKFVGDTCSDVESQDEVDK